MPCTATADNRLISNDHGEDVICESIMFDISIYSDLCRFFGIFFTSRLDFILRLKVLPEIIVIYQQFSVVMPR